MAVTFNTTEGTGWQSGQADPGPVTINLPSNAADGTLTVGLGSVYGNTAGGAFPSKAGEETVTALFDAARTSNVVYIGHYTESGTPDTSESIRARSTAGGETQGFWMTFEGFDTSTPIRSSASNNGSSTTPNFPALTGVKDGDYVIRFATWTRAWTISSDTNLSSWTKLDEQTGTHSPASQANSACLYVLESTSDQDIAAATITKSGNGPWQAVTIVIQGAVTAQSIALTTTDTARVLPAVALSQSATIVLTETDTARTLPAVALSQTANITLAEIDRSLDLPDVALTAVSTINLGTTDRAIDLPEVALVQDDSQIIPIDPVDVARTLPAVSISQQATIVLTETNRVPEVIAPSLSTVATLALPETDVTRTLPAVSLSQVAEISITAVDIVRDLPNIAIKAVGTIQLTEITRTVTLPATSLLTAGTSIELQPVDRVIDLPAVAIVQPLSIAIDPVDTVRTLPAVGLRSVATLALEPVERQIILPDLALSQQATLVLDPVDRVIDLPEVGLSIPLSIGIDPVDTARTLPAVALSQSATITIGTTDRVIDIIAPSLVGTATITIDPTDRAITLPAVSILQGLQQSIAIDPTDRAIDLPLVSLDITTVTPVKRRGGALWPMDAETARQLRVKLGLEKEAVELIEDMQEVSSEIVAQRIMEEPTQQSTAKLARLKRSKAALQARIPPTDPRLKQLVSDMDRALATAEARLVQMQRPEIIARNRKAAKLAQALVALRKFL